MAKKKNKKNKSLTLVVIVMAVICLFVGYLVGVNLLQWMKGGNEQIAQTENNATEETQISNDNQEITSEQTQANESSQTEETEAQQQTNTTTQNDNYDNLFKIQVGAFSNRSNAISFRNELADEGYNVIIKEAANYKVRVIGKETREETEKIEKELTNLGYDTFIVK